MDVQPERQGSPESSIILTTGPAARSEVRPMISQNEVLLSQSLERITRERDVLAEQLNACSAELSHLRALCDSSTLLREYRRQTETLSILVRDNARIPELEYRLRKQAKEIEALRCIVLQMQEEQQQQQQQVEVVYPDATSAMAPPPQAMPQAMPPPSPGVQPQQQPYPMQQPPHSQYSPPPPQAYAPQPHQPFFPYATQGRMYNGGLVQ